MDNNNQQSKSPWDDLARTIVETNKKIAEAEIRKHFGLDDQNNPSVFEKEGDGYLAIKGKTIKIGALGTRQYRLIKYLITPFGVSKTMDSVFDQIRLSKDRENSKLLNTITSKATREEIIRQTVKEIQRILSNNGVKKVLKFNFKNNNVKVEWR